MISSVILWQDGASFDLANWLFDIFDILSVIVTWALFIAFGFGF